MGEKLLRAETRSSIRYRIAPGREFDFRNSWKRVDEDRLTRYIGDHRQTIWVRSSSESEDLLMPFIDQFDLTAVVPVSQRRMRRL